MEERGGNKMEKGGFGRRLASQFPRMPSLCQRHPVQSIFMEKSADANKSVQSPYSLCCIRYVSENKLSQHTLYSKK